MKDIVFISYDEPNADENWEKLIKSMPHAKRVHGVKGIANAHIEAAKQVSTEHFFTVDADNEILSDFNWDKIPDFQKNDKRVHVWRCKNSVNGLIYGYGGVKLWPTNHVENIQTYSVDFTTSSASHGFKIQPQLASITKFNYTPYNAWKSGFREACKLSSELIKNPDIKSKNRLHAWLSIGSDVENGHWTLLGARLGTLYGYKNKNDIEKLSLINDFDWLTDEFNHIKDCNLYDYIDEISCTLESEYNIENIYFDPNQSKLIKELMYAV